MEIKRHISCTGLHNSHRIEKHQIRTVNHHTYSGLAGNTKVLMDVCSKRISHRIDLCISQHLTLEDYTWSLRSLSHLLSEQVNQCFRLIVSKSSSTSQFHQFKDGGLFETWNIQCFHFRIVDDTANDIFQYISYFFHILHQILSLIKLHIDSKFILTGICSNGQVVE